MLLAILLVLILIAALIAPWLLGLIAIAASLYGAYIVAATVIAVASLMVILSWMLFTGRLGGRKEEKPEIIIGERKACTFCQAEMAVSANQCSNCGKTGA